jgi:hypothetical protein
MTTKYKSAVKLPSIKNTIDSNKNNQFLEENNLKLSSNNNLASFNKSVIAAKNINNIIDEKNNFNTNLNNINNNSLNNTNLNNNSLNNTNLNNNSLNNTNLNNINNNSLNNTNNYNLNNTNNTNTNNLNNNNTNTNNLNTNNLNTNNTNTNNLNTNNTNTNNLNTNNLNTNNLNNKLSYSIVFDPPITNLNSNQELKFNAELVDNDNDTESIHCYQTPVKFQSNHNNHHNYNSDSQNNISNYSQINNFNPTEILINSSNMYSNIGKTTIFIATFFDLNKNKYSETQFQVLINYGDDSGDVFATVTQIPNTSQYIVKSQHIYNKTGHYNCVCTVIDKNINIPIISYSQYTILPKNN